MTKEELSAFANRAIDVAYAIVSIRNTHYRWGIEDNRGVLIESDGTIFVSFSFRDEDESVVLTEEDMSRPIEETVAMCKKKKQDEMARHLRLAEEKKENDRIEKEKRDRETYEKLKLKFENQ